MAIVVAECPGAVDSSDELEVTLSAANSGDTLIGVVSVNGVQDPSIDGSGWTEIVNILNGISARMKVWWKVAGASEPTVITYNHGSAVNSSGFVVRMTGAHATTPVVNDSNGSGGFGTTVTPGSAGGSGSNLILAFVHCASAGVTISDADGYSTEGSIDDSNSTAWVLSLATESSDSPTIEVDTSAIWVAATVGIDAAVGAGGMNRHLQNLGAR